MTKDELKKEAEEYAEGMAKYYASTHEGFIPSQFEKYLRGAYVSSAEPREKHIAELSRKCDELIADKLVITATYNEVLNNLNQQNDNLQKENAELKGIKDVATLIRANNDTVVTLMQLNNMLVSKRQQLTKAKEIIKTILGFMQTFGYSPSMDKFVTEAEQFLSEVEK